MPNQAAKRAQHPRQPACQKRAETAAAPSRSLQGRRAMSGHGRAFSALLRQKVPGHPGTAAHPTKRKNKRQWPAACQCRGIPCPTPTWRRRCGRRTAPLPAPPGSAHAACAIAAIFHEIPSRIYRRSANSRISRSVFSQPRQGSVMDLPYTPPSGFWQPSSR